jgi:hypothetical protein
MNEKCSVCSTVSSPLQCGHWSCRVCNYKVEKASSNKRIMYMECETCKNHTILNENEKLYILYVKRTLDK